LVVPGDGAPVEPKRVVRAETAATLRRLMEGVVLNGTGTLARLDGWTAAGKTGSVQKIDPDTGRYSPTQLIASFSGFAPINNPAVTVLISLDSPVGLHEGGQVAAPVFKRVAEQVLTYLGTPRDAPVNPKLLQASYRQAQADEGAAVDSFPATDFLTHADAPPGDSPIEPKPANKQKAASDRQAPVVTVAVDEGGDIAVPDFAGKTMRDVTEICLRLRLDPVLVGNNLALSQMPAAGAKV